MPAPPVRDLDGEEKEKDDRASRARVVFGSRLAGPQQQQRERERRWEWDACVEEGRVPARPREPDNCCMSGCVNCVWDGYRVELEEWGERAARAARVARGREGDGDGDGGRGGGDKGTMVGDEGKGEEGLYEGIDVGIREFMRTEKRLREGKERDKGRVVAVG